MDAIIAQVIYLEKHKPTTQPKADLWSATSTASMQIKTKVHKQI